jgi:DNA-binding NarL/FixJ family response regulator
LDYTPLIEQVRRNSRDGNLMLRDSRLVACSGSRLALSLLISTIQPGDQLVGAATTEAEGLTLIRDQKGTVLFCTDQLEQGCGVALVGQVKRHHPEVRTVLIFTRHQPLARIKMAIQAGCDGICDESEMGMGTLKAAIAAVSGGGLYVQRNLNAMYLAHYPGSQGPPLAPLSSREVEVLQLAAGGNSNQEIGQRLFISVETVKTHMRSVLQKLQARDRTHAAVEGLRLGLLDWPESG